MQETRREGVREVSGGKRKETVIKITSVFTLISYSFHISFTTDYALGTTPNRNI